MVYHFCRFAKIVRRIAGALMKELQELGHEVQWSLLDHITDPDRSQRRAHVRNNVQIRRAGWAMETDLRNGGISKHIKEPDRQSAISSLISLSMAQINKLEVS
jgi:hypothetical protein